MNRIRPDRVSIMAAVGVLMCLIGTSSLTAQDDTRTPLPDASAQESIQKQVREMFAGEYAKTAPDDRQSLARALFQRAIETGDDPVARYVMLNEARSVAASAGDAYLAKQAVDRLERQYRVDGTQLMYDAVSTASRTARAQDAHRRIVDVGIDLSERYVSRDEYGEGIRLMGAIRSSAGRSGDRQAVALVSERMDELGQMRAEWVRTESARKKLEENPADPEAMTTMGRFYAFAKGDFDKGMGLLLRGSDETLKKMAEMDTDNTNDANKIVERADVWWAWAEKETGINQKRGYERARHWYRVALPNLSGFTRQRVLDRAASHKSIRFGPYVYEPGAVAQYFNGGRYNQRTHVQTVSNPHFDWGAHGPPRTNIDHFSIIVQGSIKVDNAGPHRLQLSFQRGTGSLQINEHLVYSGGGGSTTVYLYKGFNAFEMRYSHGIGESGVNIRWSPADDVRLVEIPSGAFFHQPEQANPPEPKQSGR